MKKIYKTISLNDRDKTNSLLLISITLFYPAISNLIRYFINVALSIIGLPISQVAFDYFVYALLVIICIIKTRCFTPKLLISCLLFIMLYMIIYGIYGGYIFTLSKALDFMFSVVPMFILGYSLNLNKIDTERLTRIAEIILIIGIAYSFYYMETNRTFLDDNMDMAYRNLPCTLVIVAYNSKNKIFDWIMRCSGLIFITAMGTRGPIFCILFMLLLIFIQKYRILKSIIIAAVIFICINAVVSTPWYSNTMIAFSNKLINAGFSSRIVDMLLENNIGDDNGRNSIQNIIVNDIKEDPLMIRGPYSDRIATGILNDHNSGNYTHNIALELIHNYGIIFGSFFLISLTYIMLRASFKAKDDHKRLIFIAISVGFAPLLVSGSYLSSRLLFFMIGLCLNQKTLKGSNINENSMAMQQRTQFNKHST